MPTVLVVGKCSDGVLEGVGLLQRQGWEVILAASGRIGVALTREWAGDVVLTNLRCADVAPVPLLALLAGAARRDRPIVVTAPAGDGAGDRVLEFVAPDATGVQLAAAVAGLLDRRPSAADDFPRRVGAGAFSDPPHHRIVVAAGAPLHDGLGAALASATGPDLVAIFESPEGVLPATIHRYRADAVLIDSGSGLEHALTSVAHVADRCAQVRVIAVVDDTQSGTELIALLDAGAAGLVLRSASGDEILRTTLAVLDGTTVIPHHVTTTLLGLAGRGSRGGRLATLLEDERITRREREIMSLIADGLTNKEIATTLSIATFTVKSHVHNILEKLGVKTRAQVARCVHAGVHGRTLAASASWRGTTPSA